MSECVLREALKIKILNLRKEVIIWLSWMTKRSRKILL